MESELVSLMQKWPDETQGFIRRKALKEVKQSTLKGQDLLDRLGLQFLLELQSRDVAQQDGCTTVVILAAAGLSKVQHVFWGSLIFHFFLFVYFLGSYISFVLCERKKKRNNHQTAMPRS